jgi:hypothetical protein
VRYNNAADLNFRRLAFTLPLIRRSLALSLDILGLALLLLVEPYAHAIDAMPLVRGRRIALTLEDVAEVAAAGGADDLGAVHAERAVGAAHDGARHGIEEGRPAAAAAELVRGAVQRRAAAGARVGALRGEVLVQGTREGGFGAAFAQDAELFCACVLV